MAWCWRSASKSALALLTQCDVFYAHLYIEYTFAGVNQGFQFAAYSKKGFFMSISTRSLALMLTLMASLSVLGCQVHIVPDLTGLTLEEAELALMAVGLRLGDVTEEFDDSMGAGKVASQYPEENWSVAPGFRVSLVVSLGIQVPDVVGQSRSVANRPRRRGREPKTCGRRHCGSAETHIPGHIKGARPLSQ
jgi:hypothetical protein